MYAKRPYLYGSILSALFTILLLGLWGFDQASSAYRFPVDLYRNLSGTFGEPRSDHFHTGLDIKIGGQIGVPVYAIADGYVHRIKVSPFGYGNALYLKHPDGNFSVYAHLDHFNEQIDQLVYRKQVASQRFEQEIFPAAGEIPVTQSMLIGYGGNSGYSFGPHLHFEIRDPQQRIMNPLFYFRDEVRDNIAPIVQEIGFEPLSAAARVNGALEKYRVVPAGRSGQYEIPGIVEVSGPIGIEYKAYDLLNGAGNHCGINRVRLFLDNALVYEFDLWRFSFNDRRYINRHIDYDQYQESRDRFEKAYKDSGNRLRAYPTAINDGTIELKDWGLHAFRLELSDGHENTSVISGQLRHNPYVPLDTSNVTFSSAPIVRYRVKRNALVIAAECPTPEMVEGIFLTDRYGLELVLEPEYAISDELAYVLPLDSIQYPFSVFDHRDSVYFNFGFLKALSPGKTEEVSYEGLSLSFPAQSLYEQVHLQVQTKDVPPGALSRAYELGPRQVPLHLHYTLAIRPDTLILALKDKYLVVGKGEETWEYAGSEWDEIGAVMAKVRSFGTYCVMVDTLPPVFRPVNFLSGKRLSPRTWQLRVSLEDELSGIDHNSITGTLDGEWILWEYSAKNDLLLHTFRNRLERGTHELSLTARDVVGNTQTVSYQLLVN